MKAFLFILLIFIVISCTNNSPELYKVSDFTTPNGFTSGIEGPAVDSNGVLYAVNFGEQGTIGMVDSKGVASLYVKLPEGSIGNGICFDNSGRMFIADYTKHNVLMVVNQMVTVFAHDSTMNQPNDLAISDNEILFASDPNWKDNTGKLWKIDNQGIITLLEDSMGTTNGVEVSPDNKSLYVNESIQRNVWVYDLSENGDISNKRLFFKFDDFGLDGMRCDAKGNLYIARYDKGTVVKLSPEGKLIQEIVLTGKKPTNVAFGGKNGSTCFVTLSDRGCIETFETEFAGREWKKHLRNQ